MRKEGGGGGRKKNSDTETHTAHSYGLTISFYKFFPLS